jgi:hypothetical protein
MDLNQPTDLQLMDYLQQLASQTAPGPASYGQPADVSQILQQVLTQPDPNTQQMQQALLESLTGKGMTQGLNYDPARESGMNFTGPVAGYSGPLRPSDVPTSYGTEPNIPVYHGTKLSPQSELARVEATQVAPGMSGREAMDLEAVISKLPKEVQAAIYKHKSPSLDIASEADRARSGKAQTVLNQNLGKYYHRQTGEPATSQFLVGEADPNVINSEYVLLKDQKDIERLNALNKFDNLIKDYAAVKQHLPAKAGVGVAGNAAKLTAGSWVGSPIAKDVESVNARLTELATTLGGDKRTSNMELGLLKNAAVGKFDSQESADVAVQKLQRLRDEVAKTLPIPGLHNRYSKGGAPAQQGVQQSKPAQGLQQGYVPMLNAQGQPVQVRAELAQQRLQQGYRPFQQ